MRISTKYKTNDNGRGQILATGSGRQRTVSYDDAQSSQWNHGNAAGTLALVLIEGKAARKVAARTAKVIDHGPNKMRFSLGE